MTYLLPEPFHSWFAARGWAAHPHQLALLEASAAGQSALLIAPTGGGKTLAGFLPALVSLAEQPDRGGLHTLYISPLKALAVDVQRNLQVPIAEMGLAVTVEARTGDTPANRRARNHQSGHRRLPRSDRPAGTRRHADHSRSRAPPGDHGGTAHRHRQVIV